MAVQTGTTSLGVATSLRTTYTNPLLDDIHVGHTVMAWHLTTLAAFINAIAAHTHTLDEYSVIHEYGNTQTNSTAFVTRTTDAANITPVTLSGVAAGTTITAVHHNTLAVGANDAIAHTHGFSDDNGV